jgi:hypothetical protein
VPDIKSFKPILNTILLITKTTRCHAVREIENIMPILIAQPFFIIK